MADLEELPDKRDVARGLLLRGSVFVHLDPRLEGVQVPAWLSRQPQLVLQIGLDLPIPIPDLRVDEEGVFATLSFSRTPYACVVPWKAVFALVGEDGRGMVWPEDLPAEIAAEVDREAGRRAPQPPTEELAEVTPLTPLDPGKRRKTSGPGSGDKKRRGSTPLPPYLRVIK